MAQIAPDNILRHELIGLEVEIARAKNPKIRRARGIVVNETRNMLTIANKRRKRLIPKDVAVFRFELPNGAIVDVDGARLVARPENRLKTKVKRW